LSHRSKSIKENPGAGCSKKGYEQVMPLIDMRESKRYTVEKSQPYPCIDKKTWDQTVKKVCYKNGEQNNPKDKPKERLNCRKRMGNESEEQTAHEEPPNEQKTDERLDYRVLHTKGLVATS
jgi:hypothetical protein